MKTVSQKIAQLSVALLLVAAWSGWACAQDTPDQGSSGAVPAATGLDTTTQTIENPPLSGLDEPSFEPGFGARSYLVPKAQVSESLSSNPTGALSSTTPVKDITRASGSLLLQKLWRIHPLDVDYTGGVSWYHGVKGRTFQTHTMAATQRLLWRTGQLALRDSFTYLPEGGFGMGSFGGAGGFGGGLGGLGGGTGGVGGGILQFGSVGNQPRITNMSLVDVTQALSPRASVTMAGGYGFTDFLTNPQGFVNSQQSTAQAGYNYQLTRRDQIAVSYGFQEFHFPRAGAGSFNVNAWNGIYGHRISGKLNFSAGGGPQWIQIHRFLANNSVLSGTGHVRLLYHMSARTNMNLSYIHYATAGSGLFAGANSDVVRYALNHRLTRQWSFSTDTGYSRHSRILSVPTATANNAHIYSYWYAGGGMRRQFGHQFGAFASYQFDKFQFGSGFCGPSNTNCKPGYNRHVGLIGLDWTPHPIRLD